MNFLTLRSMTVLSLPTVFLLIFASFVLSCKKTDQQSTLPFPPQPEQYFITEMVDTATSVGMIINDPINKRQYALFGHKDGTGTLDTIYQILETFPGTEDWLAHEFDEDFLPTKTTTSTGHTIEYTNLDKNLPSKGTVTVKETTTGKVLFQKDALDFSDDFAGVHKEAKKIIKSGNVRQRNKMAEMVYLGTQLASCAMGVASFSMGAPLATVFSIYKIAQSCKSAVETIQNLLNGQPAFGCASAKDHAKAFHGFTKGVMNATSVFDMVKKTLPGALGYLSKMAGQEGCDKKDKEDEEKPLPEATPRDLGSLWGDPHLLTLDGFQYDFQGFGEFIIAKSLADNFEVQARLGNPYLSNPNTTYNIGVAVQTGNDKVCFLSAPSRLYINGTLQPSNFSSIPLNGGGAVTKQTVNSKDEIIIKHKHGDLVKLRLISGNYFDYSVQITEDRKSKMEGLLGNYDGVANNDLRLRTGEAVQKKFSDLYPKFADSWRVSNDQSLFWYEAGKSTSTYTRMDLPKAPVTISADQYEAATVVCHSAGVQSEPYLSACILDVASSGDAAVAASSYAQQEDATTLKFPVLIPAQFKLNGDAQVVDNSIRLTKNSSFLAGHAFDKETVQQDFEADFVFRFGISNNGGADGIAFVIAKDLPVTASNPYPGHIGKLGYEGMPASLAIEFDTNIDGDESSNHAAIHSNGGGANSSDIKYRLAYNKDIAPLKDGMFHAIKIRYQSNKLQVWMDGSLVLTKDINLKQSLGLADNYVLGVTASTSHSSQAHYLHSWVVKKL